MRAFQSRYSCQDNQCMYCKCACVPLRSPYQCAKSLTVLWDVVGAEPSCVRRWGGRTVVRGFTVPSVGNSVKVRINTERSACR